jgi:hypothetical protein
LLLIAKFAYNYLLYDLIKILLNKV